MALKYRFNLKDIKLEDFRVYLLALFKAIIPKKKLKISKILNLLFKKNQHGYHKSLCIII